MTFVHMYLLQDGIVSIYTSMGLSCYDFSIIELLNKTNAIVLEYTQVNTK